MTGAEETNFVRGACPPAGCERHPIGWSKPRVDPASRAPMSQNSPTFASSTEVPLPGTSRRAWPASGSSPKAMTRPQRFGTTVAATCAVSMQTAATRSSTLVTGRRRKDGQPGEGPDGGFHKQWARSRRRSARHGRGALPDSAPRRMTSQGTASGRFTRAIQTCNSRQAKPLGPPWQDPARACLVAAGAPVGQSSARAAAEDPTMPGCAIRTRGC